MGRNEDLCGSRCHYCQTVLGYPRNPPTRDHVVPKSLGGTDDDWNIVPSCKPCNRSKDAWMPTCPCGICRDAVKAWQSA